MRDAGDRQLGDEPPLELPGPDVREATVPDAGEHRDPAQRRRALTADETADAVGRAQTTLADTRLA